MNINQIMNIFDWDMSIVTRLELGDTEFSNVFGENKKYIIVLDFLCKKCRVCVIFNKLTSEVYYINLSDCGDGCNGCDDEWWITDEYSSKFDAFLVSNDYEYNETTLEEILDELHKLTEKEPDEFLPIDIDTDMLVLVDESASKLDITRNDFLTKVILDYIAKEKENK